MFACIDMHRQTSTYIDRHPSAYIGIHRHACLYMHHHTSNNSDIHSSTCMNLEKMCQPMYQPVTRHRGIRQGWSRLATAGTSSCSRKSTKIRPWIFRSPSLMTTISLRLSTRYNTTVLGSIRCHKNCFACTYIYTYPYKLYELIYTLFHLIYTICHLIYKLCHLKYKLYALIYKTIDSL
jgi:hypothetical protein